MRQKGFKCNLGHRGKKYKSKKTSDACLSYIPNRVDISKCSRIIEGKTRIGDREVDTVISQGSNYAVLTLEDRHFKYVVIRKINQKTSQNVNDAAINALKKLKLPRYPITFDNGNEFARHHELKKNLGAGIYFSRLYKFCDRVLYEHTNGLIRRFLSENLILKTFRSITFSNYRKFS